MRSFAFSTTLTTAGLVIFPAADGTTATATTQTEQAEECKADTQTASAVSGAVGGAVAGPKGAAIGSALGKPGGLGKKKPKKIGC